IADHPPVRHRGQYQVLAAFGGEVRPVAEADEETHLVVAQMNYRPLIGTRFPIVRSGDSHGNSFSQKIPTHAHMVPAVAGRRGHRGPPLMEATVWRAGHRAESLAATLHAGTPRRRRSDTPQYTTTL